MPNINWETDIDSVQDYWNHLETELLQVIDMLSLLTKFKNGNAINTKSPKLSLGDWESGIESPMFQIQSRQNLIVNFSLIQNSTTKLYC